MRLFQRGAQGDVQDDCADGGEQRVDQRDAAGDLGHDGDKLCRLAKDVQVAEIADERIGKHIDQQAAERRCRDGGHILDLVVCVDGVDEWYQKELEGQGYDDAKELIETFTK